MAIRNVVKTGDPILTKVCRPVEKFDAKLAQLLDDMHETMTLANGVGLAAPQVGLLRRIVVIDVGEGPIELINPVIVDSSGKQDGPEGCLSFPGEYGLVERPNYVKVRAQDRNGDWYEAEGEELLARAFCHELDHLDGVLFVTKVSRMLDPEELNHEDGDDDEDYVVE